MSNTSWRSGGCWACVALALALGGCVAPLAIAQASAAAVTGITGITLERDCSGCSNASILVLSRDGTATYTLKGNARQGTHDIVSKGSVRIEDFDKLAQLVVAQGYFALDASYEDPQVRDGPWATASVTRGGVDKQVFSRDDAGPAPLKTVLTGIEALKARIVFVPQR